MPDIVLAAGVAGLLLADALLGAGTLRPVDGLLLLAASMVLAARRRAPRTVLLIALVCVFAYITRVEHGQVAVVPVLVALYTVVGAGHRTLGAATTVLLATAAVVSGLSGGSDGPIATAVQNALVPVGWFVAAFVLGEVTRHRRAYLEQVERRAEDAERNSEEVARRRAVQERLRIARELHDSLTHSISVITVQAGVAVHLAGKRGERAPDALVAIQDASRDAMRELRSTLDVLRDDGGGPGPGLDQLDELVARTRAAGLPASVRVTGQPRALPREVELTAYRIIQEALTNVSRHAGAASAAITLDYGGDELTVRVDDDGTATPANGTAATGVGLRGMRERVAGLGGSLHAAPRPGGGFTVRAGIPIREPRP